MFWLGDLDLVKNAGAESEQSEGCDGAQGGGDGGRDFHPRRLGN